MNQISRATRESFRNLPLVAAEFINSVKEKDLDVNRNEETWTIREHLYHMVNVQEMLQGRMILIRDSDNPVIKPYFPEDDTIGLDDYEDAKEALDIYSAYRKAQMQILETLSPEDWEKHGEHGEYRDYSLAILIRHMVFHEYWHLHRSEEILYIKDRFFS